MGDPSTPEWRDGWVEGFEAMRRRCIALLMANKRLDLAPLVLGIEAKPPAEKTAPERY
jgi:hypothetical protein